MTAIKDGNDRVLVTKNGIAQNRSHRAVVRNPSRGMARVSLLSTYYENIGDDLIRDGLEFLFRGALEAKLHFNHLSKGNPLGLWFPKSYYSHGPIHRMPVLGQRAIRLAHKIIELSCIQKGKDRFADSDIFAVAGTPLFYNLTFGTFLDLEPWIDHIYNRRLLVSDKPLIAVGLGSIFEETPEEFLLQHPRERDFIAQFVERSTFITTRDTPTLQLLESAAGKRNNIRKGICPSLWAAERFGVKRGPESDRSSNICVSFSLESAKWDSDSCLTREKRLKAFHAVVEHLRTRKFTVQLIAHNEFDVALQSDLAREFRCPPPIRATSQTLLEILAKAHSTITWRVHAALGAHSVGTPALLFRTDSRYRHPEELGVQIVDDRELKITEVPTLIDSFLEEAPARTARTFERLQRLKLGEFAYVKTTLQELL